MSSPSQPWPERAPWSRGIWRQLALAVGNLVLLPGRLAWSVLRAGARRRHLADQLRRSSRTPLSSAPPPPEHPDP